MDFRQVKAIENANKKRITEIFGKIPEESGIYILTRQEDGFKYAYIGQAKHILTRLAQHLNGYQHIDLSLKKHGFISSENPNGWDINFIRCDVLELDKREQYFIKMYANGGWQLRNKTAGGQGEGKAVFDTAKQPKTYTEGKAYGRKQVLAEIKHIVDLHLVVTVKKDNKNDKKALDKFFRLINGE